MLKSLYPAIDWEKVCAVGFDLDGTLYDEAEFISQVYRSIADYLSKRCSMPPDEVYRRMFLRWLEKGSSYNRIFEETLEYYGYRSKAIENVEADCLAIFRKFEPCLTLPARVSTLLDYMQEHFTLFIITDGSALLQSAKIKSLHLERWFAPEQIGISGCYGADFAKPSTKIIHKLKMIGSFEPQNVVFFGDRTVDQQFSAAAGFHFVEVASLIGIMR